MGAQQSTNLDHPQPRRRRNRRALYPSGAQVTRAVSNARLAGLSVAAVKLGADASIMVFDLTGVMIKNEDNEKAADNALAAWENEAFASGRS